MEDRTALATVLPAAALSDAEMAAFSYLARYTGRTVEAYRLDLRQWFAWCDLQGIDPLHGVKRAHIELYGRWLQGHRNLAPATAHRRLTTVAGFFRFAHLDAVIDTNPSAYIRLPKVSSESQRLGLDRMELTAFIAAGRTAKRPDDGALAVLLGVLGLRVSEACAVQIEDLGVERGHRTLRLVGKGNKPALIPLPPPVARAIDICAGERTTGPLMHTTTGHPAEPSWARRVVRRLAKQAGIKRNVFPHLLRQSMITAGLDAGVPIRDMQVAARHADPRTTTRYDRARHNLDRHASYIISAYVTGAS